MGLPGPKGSVSMMNCIVTENQNLNKSAEYFKQGGGYLASQMGLQYLVPQARKLRQM